MLNKDCLLWYTKVSKCTAFAEFRPPNESSIVLKIGFWFFQSTEKGARNEVSERDFRFIRPINV